MVAFGDPITVYSADMSVLNHLWTCWLGLKRLLILCCVFHGLCVVPTESLAGDSTISRLSFQVRVVDEENRPIAGVTIRTLGLRMKVGRGTGLDWDPKQHGPASAATTDSSGVASLSYPEWAADQVETGSVDCSFDHPAYVSTRTVVGVGSDEVRIRLQRGVRLAVTATYGSSDTRIHRNLYGLLCGHQDGTEWKLFSNGTLMSRTVARERDRLLVLHLPDEGLPLWSELLRPQSSVNTTRVMLRDVPLMPGMRLTGQLPDDVPRPISNGYVSILATHHTGMRDPGRRMQWRDWVPIDRNGRFEFPSLPRDGFVQLFAFCDGWNSASPTPDNLEKVGLAEFRPELRPQYWHPQVFRLRRSDRFCEIPMIRTAGCRIRLVSESGERVSGVTVIAHAQQKWISGDSEPAGSGFSTPEFLRLPVEQRDQIVNSSDMFQQGTQSVRLPSGIKYRQKANEGGWVTFTDLPVARSDEPGRHSFSVVSRDERGTASAGHGVSAVESGQSTELTLRLTRP